MGGNLEKASNLNDSSNSTPRVCPSSSDQCIDLGNTQAAKDFIAAINYKEGRSHFGAYENYLEA